jgi:AcrR family transcriptional regulator
VNQNDPRVKRTRQLLQQAFMELIHEKSFEAITVQDIAERSTLNRATFYAHYEDKYALLDATAGTSFAETLRRRIACDAMMSEETLRRLVLAVCDYHGDLSKQCERAYQTLESLLAPRIRTTLHDLVLGCLLRTEAFRECRHETLEMAATVVSWAIYGATLRWKQEGKARSAEVLAETLFPLLMGSIAAMSA